MELRSSSFNDGDYLAMDHVLSADFGFGCSGSNRSPQLSWSGAPEATRSFAVTCYDPDAPTGSGFWHWVVANIPATVTELPLDAGGSAAAAAGAGAKMPAGALQVRNDVGTRGYVGPCPPQGDHPHRYIFTVFAVGLDQLPINEDTSAAVVGFQLHFNTLAKATLMGLYKH
jgi:Raf kinase inhibitor-like YbhB/YbcL family protein